MAKILVTDDSSFSRGSLSKGLRALGHEVEEAADGAEAVEKIAAGGFDCVFLDLLMPVMDGFQVLEAVGALKDPPRVVVCSSDIQHSTRARCLKLGVAGFLDKPFMPKHKDILEGLLLEVLSTPAKRGRSPLSMCTETELEAVKELVNIGIGKASLNLNALLESHICLNVPEIKLMPACEARANFQAELKDEPFSCARLDFSGSFSGFSALLLSRESALRLVALLTGGQAGDRDEDMDSLKVGTISEVGNIVLNSVMGSISNVLSGRLEYRLPSYRELSLSRLMESAGIDGKEVVLVARTEFVSERRDVRGDILLVMEIGSFGNLLQGVRGAGGK